MCVIFLVCTTSLVVQKKSVSEESNIDYSHHSSVKDFQLVISGVFREDSICNVKNSDCFSLMFDESTDVCEPEFDYLY